MNESLELLLDILLAEIKLLTILIEALIKRIDKDGED